MPPNSTSTPSCSTSLVALASATLSMVALSSRCSSSRRPSKPPCALMSSMTIRATLAFAMPDERERTGLVRDHAHFDGWFFHGSSSELRGPAWPVHARRMPAASRPHMGKIPYAECYFVLDQAALEGVKSRARAGGDADLRIQALDVVVGGLGGDVELAGRFLGRVAGRDQPQDLDLARGQPGQALGRRAARGLPGAGEHRFDGVGAELPFLDRAAKLGGRRRVAGRRPVGPRLARGLERFGGGQDAGGRREIRAARVAVVAAAVEPLVMALHERGDDLAVAAQRRQRALAVVGVQPGGVRLALGQGAGPHPGRDGHGQLADVVGVGRPADVANVGRREGPCAWRRAAASDATARECPNVNGIRMSMKSAIAR